MKISNRDIIDKVIEWINNGYYVTINSDERMLPDTAGYQSKIFHNHQGFYFGYDIVKCKMKMLNFDTKMNYRIIDVDFKNLIRSFESEELIKSLDEKGFDSYLIQLRKVKQDVIDYNYTDSNTIVYIQQYLYEYLNGINSSKKNLLSYEILKDNDWGVNVYETLFACLQGKYSNRFLFQGVCGLCEHKNLMLKRIHYLKERGYDIEEKTLTEYESVVKFFDKFKHIALKSILSNQYQLLNDYIKELKIIIALEKKVLERIVKSME
ncbi:hypothetical protein C8E03_101229 [Lachnotalea glycerini]|uniref:Uncharacterized protein n=1 Tax=Lachnotalea glycerini TaxID=1763509 RepID=A0A318ESV7_9FIRM|nr:hypothetical protein [Lachnotalea glycerini]PXV95600.1 hypothetical protein C8E03_101229 [Lachnotalea glycerini]